MYTRRNPEVKKYKSCVVLYAAISRIYYIIIGYNSIVYTLYVI